MRKTKSRRARNYPIHHLLVIKARRFNRILEKYGFKMIGFTQYKWEYTFLFETEDEATYAYEVLEKDKKLLCGWWYGYDQWKNYVLEEGRTIESYRVITDFKINRRRVFTENLLKYLLSDTDFSNLENIKHKLDNLGYQLSIFKKRSK